MTSLFHQVSRQTVEDFTVGTDPRVRPGRWNIGVLIHAMERKAEEHEGDGAENRG